MKHFAKRLLLVSTLFLAQPVAAGEGAVVADNPGAGQAESAQPLMAKVPARIVPRRETAIAKATASNTPARAARPRYEQHRPASEGLAAVSRHGLWGFVDRQGQEIIAPQFEAVWEFREGMAAVKKNGRWGFIDASGRMIIAAQYDNALSFGEGRAPVEKNGRWGFIDASGREVITPRYDKVWPFENGRAIVVNNGHHRQIDRNGQNMHAAAIAKR
ncbi:MAG: WG repeat-containing protein [Cardiobacteriaceae bacterium]|nr:WG repeat-containing protein [Cardiobacteriaceae bacterium]